jgi:hypothetical protein
MLVEGPGFGKDHRLALVRGNDAWGELRPFRTGIFEEGTVIRVVTTLGFKIWK